jgi:hypothetical protein
MRHAPIAKEAMMAFIGAFLSLFQHALPLHTSVDSQGARKNRFRAGQY